jgi:hypothetical protein
VLTSWDEVVKEFYRAPARWWHKCMSELGNDNQLAQLKQSMYVEDGKTGQVTQVTLRGSCLIWVGQGTVSVAVAWSLLHTAETGVPSRWLRTHTIMCSLATSS